VIDSAAVRVRLDSVRERIARAAERARRDPAAVRLVAVSKTFPADAIRAAAAAGQRDFGENKLQEALVKMSALADLPLTWHLIGHLQSNKAKRAGGAAHWIHSIDSGDLLARVADGAAAAGRTVDVLIQVDLAREPTKHGALPETLTTIIDGARQLAGCRLRGLMLLPPFTEDPEGARPYFSRLREVRDRLLAGGADPAMLQELSMGMSHDFDVAVEEGATMVRVGSAIFGTRTK
jgi:pyridoxal phosphate enzyme (YggS family)